MKDISQNLLSYRSTIQDLLHALNQGIYGAVFVVDDNSVMVGIFTDGDVRRALLKGAKLGDRVDRYMNRSFIAGSVQLSRQENIKLLSETIRHLPILDDGRPVDIVSWAQMWRLPITEPSLGGAELKYISDCVTSNWISSQGEYVRLFGCWSW
jgi:perosamine synthetase